MGQFRVNFGQKDFKGDPKGYKPFDTNYSPSKWLGGDVSGDLVTPKNLETVVYDKRYTSGQYYYEVQFLTQEGGAGVAHGLGLINKNETDIRRQAIALAYLGDYRRYTYVYRKGYGGYNEESAINQWSDYNITAGDWVQVWVDYDNDRVYMKKLHTTKEQHINFIEP